MRESWTDARLDDFAAHTDKRFDEVDRRFDEVDRRFDRVDTEFRAVRQEMNQRFDRVEGRLDALQRTIILSNAGMFAAVIGLIATQL